MPRAVRKPTILPVNGSDIFAAHLGRDHAAHVLAHDVEGREFTSGIDACRGGKEGGEGSEIECLSPGDDSPIRREKMTTE